jgi:SAM-dependent methyltransferase
MGIGGKTRRLFGRHERSVAAVYRRFFVDLDALADEIKGKVQVPVSILEIGCGEGQMTERLSRVFPEARILGIDLVSMPGRLFRGDRSRVRFESCNLESIANQHPRAFCMVVLADVLHHIPTHERKAFLSLAGTFVADHGVFVFKEWAKLPSLGYALGYAADRYVTGDRVTYHSPAELRSLAALIFDDSRVVAEWRIGPWKSNTCLLVRRADDHSASETGNRSPESVV